MQWRTTLPLEVKQRHTLALAKNGAHSAHPCGVQLAAKEESVQGALMPELREIVPEAFPTRIKRAGIVNTSDSPILSRPL